MFGYGFQKQSIVKTVGFLIFIRMSYTLVLFNETIVSMKKLNSDIKLPKFQN